MPRPARILPPVLLALAVAGAVLTIGPADGLGARGQDDTDATALRPWPLEVPLSPRPRRSTVGERAARLAPAWVGVPYRYGGEGPAGFDCSGFTRFVYGKVGVRLPHNAAAQYAVGRAVRRSKLRPGDLVFFDGLGHVGLYLGHGKLIHAPQTGGHVEVVPLSGYYGERLVGARRVVTG